MASLNKKKSDLEKIKNDIYKVSLKLNDLKSIIDLSEEDPSIYNVMDKAIIKQAL